MLGHWLKKMTAWVYPKLAISLGQCCYQIHQQSNTVFSNLWPLKPSVPLGIRVLMSQNFWLDWAFFVVAHFCHVNLHHNPVCVLFLSVYLMLIWTLPWKLYSTFVTTWKSDTGNNELTRHLGPIICQTFSGWVVKMLYAKATPSQLFKFACQEEGICLADQDRKVCVTWHLWSSVRL